MNEIINRRKTNSKITKLRIASDDTAIKKIFMFALETEKGLLFSCGDPDPPKDCIEEIDIKPDEYILGFLGNITDALDGFGIYVAKIPVIRR